MKGLLIKKHSNFYYVKTYNSSNIYECMLRERLKKEAIEVVVGDYVDIEELNEETSQAVITSLYDRDTYITRPNIANMEQNIIVLSLKQPALDIKQLDRFLIHTKLSGLNQILCVNKCDLKDKKNILSKLKEIYEPLGLEIIEISALNNVGIDKLIERLINKRSVLSGPSGVGKSTILNTIKPGLKLKVGKIGSKSQKGTHTTRHSELVFIDFENNSHGIIADTPGFSYLRFDKYLPEEVEAAFDEFLPFKEHCYYSDCMHINEEECGIKLNLDKISSSRYESYCRFVSEALEYKEKLSSMSIKDEGKVKIIDSTGNNQIRRLKLGHNLVDVSRKTYKQKLSSFTNTDKSDQEIDDNL